MKKLRYAICLLAETRRMRVSDFALKKIQEGHNVVMAVNASPWGPWGDPKINHLYADNVGLLVSDGKVIAMPHSKKKDGVPALVVLENGKADMIFCKQGDDVSKVRMAVSGFFFVLRNGEFVYKPAKEQLHPRTFYGLSEDKSVLYIAVADGRQPGVSNGMTCNEGAQLMKHLGAHDAINMDGGGSTTLVTVRKKVPILVNAPSDAKNFTGEEKIKHTRHVATALGVCYGKKKKTETD